MLQFENEVRMVKRLFCEPGSHWQNAWEHNFILSLARSPCTYSPDNCRAIFLCVDLRGNGSFFHGHNAGMAAFFVGEHVSRGSP
jgi:hypothetical protein